MRLSEVLRDERNRFEDAMEEKKNSLTDNAKMRELSKEKRERVTGNVIDNILDSTGHKSRKN